MARRRDIDKNDILDTAERLFQTLGYNGFSIRDLSAEVGITSASLHHHFPTKGDLATAATERYRGRLNKAMAEIEAESDDWTRRRSQIMKWFRRVAGDDRRICLLGTFAADFMTLPASTQAEVRLLHSNLLGWLARFITAAQRSGQAASETAAEDQAYTLLALIQGALLTARTAAASPGDEALDWLQ